MAPPRPCIALEAHPSAWQSFARLSSGVACVAAAAVAAAAAAAAAGARVGSGQPMHGSSVNAPTESVAVVSATPAAAGQPEHRKRATDPTVRTRSVVGGALQLCLAGEAGVDTVSTAVRSMIAPNRVTGDAFAPVAALPCGQSASSAPEQVGHLPTQAAGTHARCHGLAVHRVQQRAAAAGSCCVRRTERKQIWQSYDPLHGSTLMRLEAGAAGWPSILLDCWWLFKSQEMLFPASFPPVRSLVRGRVQRHTPGKSLGLLAAGCCPARKR